MDIIEFLKRMKRINNRYNIYEKQGSKPRNKPYQKFQQEARKTEIKP
jgi:hypothetical protein